MQCTIQYFQEIYGIGNHPLATKLLNGEAKVTSSEVAYILIKEEINESRKL